MSLTPCLIEKISDNDPLENHVTTISHYMQLVRSCDADLVMTTLMPMFMQYMVAISWRKMRRRISVWAAQGFIYHLGQVDERALRAVVPSTVTNLQNDSLLSDRLIEMEGEHIIPSALLSACRKMLLMPRPDRKEQSKEWSGLYSRDTCFEFHQLLVSTLLNYGKALDSLGAAHGAHLKKPNEQEPVQKMVDSAKQIWEHGRLLWAIAYSRILEDHLSVLRRQGWLPLPQNEERQVEQFSNFTSFDRKANRIANPPRQDEVGRDGGDAVEGGDQAGEGGEGGEDTVNEDKNEGGEGGEDTVNRDEKEGGEGGEDTVNEDKNEGGEGGEDTVNKDENEGDCEEQDIQSIINDVLLSDDKNFASIYLGWIRLQVDRWQAPRKITTFVMHAKTTPVDLTLLAARHPKPILIRDAMDPWENAINDLCARKKNQLIPGEVISLLKGMIGKMRAGDRRGTHSIFKAFDPQSAEKSDHHSTVHCEAILATLSKFPDRAAGDSNLREQLRV